MLTGKEAVIFDMDGTLIDSMWVWSKIDGVFLAKYGYEVPSDLHHAIEGMSFSQTAQYFKERFLIEDSVEHIQGEWNRMAFEMYVKEVPLKPGVENFVKGARKKGLKLAIATSNSRRLADAVLKAHNIDACFNTIVTDDEVCQGKPEPDVYLTAARIVDVNPDKCLVFEDLCMGIMAGKRAGMEVCAVRDAFSDYQWDEKIKMADYHIETYDGILNGE